MISGPSKQPRQPASPRHKRGTNVLRRPTWTIGLLAVVFLFLAAACTDTSPALGRHHQGRTLNVSIVSIESVPELIYATIDPESVVRQWRLEPSTDELELVLVRLQVQNHTAVNAVFNVDKSGAQLRDITNQDYFPLTVGESVLRDFRGQLGASVRMDLGQCFDSFNTLADTGANVEWVNESGSGHFLQFDPDDFAADRSALPGVDGRVEIPANGSFSQSFGLEGTFDYECGNADTSHLARLIVETPGGRSETRPRNVVFLEGPFELPRGHGVDGWMIFEAPPDTQFRDFRWRAGDSITIRF